MRKQLFRALMAIGFIAVFTLAVPLQAAEQGTIHDSDQEATSIVGSWMITLDEGPLALISFTSDGIAFSSVQSEVNSSQGVFMPQHGAWAQVGRRRFALTLVSIGYDIQTAEYRGSFKIRARLTLTKSGTLTGDATADHFDAAGNLTTLKHSLRFTRIGVEPVD
jgi:hypothetical protein